MLSVGEGAKAWLMWLLWSLTLIAVAGVSYIIKPDLHWDSTAVFAVMMGFMLSVLGVNWTLSKNSLPFAEVAILAIVFILGIVPRVLDGYDVSGAMVHRKPFCGPDEPLQAHAVWHVLSAIALALTYDLLQKARPVYESSPATILLSQGRELSDLLGAPTRQQGVAAIMLKFILAVASVLLLFVGLYNGTALGVIGAVIALLFSLGLWLWPLVAK